VETSGTSDLPKFGTVIFKNAATAGSKVVLTNSGGAVANGPGGHVTFLDSTNAGEATIANQGSQVEGAVGGSTEFLDNSSASHAQIIVNPGENNDVGDGGGRVHFRNNASAGDSHLIVRGGAHDNGSGAAVAEFWDTSTAGNANCELDGASFPDAIGGLIRFLNNSNAGQASFVVNGAQPTGDLGAQIDFIGNSNAANGEFIVNGGTVGFESEFGANRGGLISFRFNSSAGNATLTTNPANVSDGLPGYVAFRDTATAGNAYIVNNAATIGGTLDLNTTGGGTIFDRQASAGVATIVAHGGTAPGTGGGLIQFNRNSTAGSSTLIANSGSNGGSGGLIEFLGSSDGANSFVRAFGNGALDIGAYDGAAGTPVKVGSVAGDGNIFLGARELQVGNTNTYAVFTGTIQEGGVAARYFKPSGPGSLRKVGSNRLTLTRSNTYAGGTVIQSGILEVNNSPYDGSATGVGPIGVLPGATLEGSGRIFSRTDAWANSTVSAGPANSVGVLTILNSLNLHPNSIYRCDINSQAQTADTIVADGVTIDSAVFSLNELGRGVWPMGAVIMPIENISGSRISGQFTNLQDGSLLISNGTVFRVSYRGGDGNDLTLTVVASAPL
jgi:autotransporter-associated beta strand protein